MAKHKIELKYSMKVGDLIRHKKCGDFAIILKMRGLFIDFMWLDDASLDKAYSGLFEVISEGR